MDRRLDPQSRWNRDRRIASGPRLAGLLVKSDAVSFDELVEAAEPAETADVATWLSHAILGGLIEEVEPQGEGEPRLFRLRRTQAEQRWQRRQRDGSQPDAG
jgi:hypothetical protein